MTPESALEITHFTLVTAAKVASPYLISSIIIGVFMNVFQTVTQLKDQSLTFIPKVAAVAIAGVLTMPWQVHLILGYFTYIFELFASV